jgi:hypothetical protein
MGTLIGPKPDLEAVIAYLSDTLMRVLGQAPAPVAWQRPIAPVCLDPSGNFSLKKRRFFYWLLAQTWRGGALDEVRNGAWAVLPDSELSHTLSPGRHDKPPHPNVLHGSVILPQIDPAIGSLPNSGRVLAEFEYGRHRFAWRFDHSLSPIVGRWAEWAWINSSVYERLRTRAGASLFDAFSACLSGGVRRLSAPVSDVRLLLGVRPNSLPGNGSLGAFLDDVLKDVNTSTPLAVTYEAICKRRTGMIMAFEFDITSANEHQNLANS